VAAGVFGLVLLAPVAALADGFRNPFQNAAALGQGNAFAAQADDASAVFYNPAAMTQLPGVQLLSGVELVHTRTQFRSLTGETTENVLHGAFGLPPPGQLFLTATPRDLGIRWLGDLTAGIGLQNLYGFATRYPQYSPLQTAVTSASLPLLDVKPTVAYRLTDWLSLGAGADVFMFWPDVTGTADQKFISPGLPGIPPGTRVEITGQGTAAGANASAFVTPLRAANGQPRVNVGFVWRSQGDLPLDGSLRLNGVRVATAHSSLHFPDSYTGALAVWPLREASGEWKIEADVDYVRWSTIHKSEFRFSNGVVLSTPQNWHNAWTIGIGTEYKWRPWRDLPAWDLALRSGCIRSMTPVSDQNFTPAFADSNVTVLSAGLGLTCRAGGRFLGLRSCGQPGEGAARRELIGVDLAYQLFLFEPRTVTGNPNPAVNGTYRTTIQLVSLSLRVGF
jgi:long-chain fatty acid transport protein